MDQTGALLNHQPLNTNTVPRNTHLQIGKKSSDHVFQKMLAHENNLTRQQRSEEPVYNKQQDDSLEVDDTLSFLDKDRLEDIDEAFEFLNKLLNNDQEDIGNLQFMQQLFGTNPEETINEALERLVSFQGIVKEFDFTKFPPDEAGMELLNGLLRNGLDKSFEGTSNEEKEALLTLLSFGKLIVLGSEHTVSNQKVAENVDQLAVLLSKWRDKLSSVNETRQVIPEEAKNTTSSIRDIGMKVYNQQSGVFTQNSKLGSTGYVNPTLMTRNADIKLNQTVMIGELQLQTQQQNPVLPLEKGGQAVGADEFIKTFESIQSKANYTNQNGVQKLFIRLTPENLGTLQIELSQKDGQLVAKIMANTQRGKEMLDSQLQGLRVTLAAQGISFDKIDFEQAADARFREDSPPEERRNQNEYQEENDLEENEEESLSGFLSMLEDSMINQGI